VVDWIHEADGISQTTWIRHFLEWVRVELAPRYEDWKRLNP
jgi:hypothetical protein